MRSLLFSTLLLLMTARPISAQAPPSEAFFEDSIRPILAGTCFRCHGGERTSGGLRVDSRKALLDGGDSGPALVPGLPDQSLLLHAVQRLPDVSAMPPALDQALSAGQIQAFRSWITAGAPWPEAGKAFQTEGHWAFQPLSSPALPPASDEWFQTEIDAFVLRSLQTDKLQPRERADRRTLLRRVTFDLTGLPPTHKELLDFQQDSSPDAFAGVVDRLLSSPAYGEKWGRHWLDIVRYADTAGETADYPVPEAWRYRNYVIDAFNSDMPFNQFVREQIAGDILARQTLGDRFAEQTTATGYLAISRRFGFDSENYHHLTIHDTIDSVGQTFLGLSIGCARCHDHKFDPISMQEYYALYGIFDSSRYPFPGSEQKQKVRSLAPLVPLQQATEGWRNYTKRTGDLAHRLAALQRPVPTAVLRSLTELDGDFELQAPAAGGSYGVPVPPWLYTGPASVTNDAQSPFQNVYPRGRQGISIPAGTQPWQLLQAIKLPDANHPQQLWFGLDFRVRGSSADTAGHRIRLLSSLNGQSLELRLHQGQVLLQSQNSPVPVGHYQQGEWTHLQLELDLHSGELHCRLQTDLQQQQFRAETTVWQQSPDLLGFSADTDTPNLRPALDIDNAVVQTVPLAPASREWSVTASGGSPESIAAQLRQLAGIDGDLELQPFSGPLTAPWNAGPGSVVKLRPESQSPLRNTYGEGTRGLYLPSRAEYDGFGLTITELPLDTAGRVNLAFDVRPWPASENCGSWRYYIGHGPGSSAAVELHFTDRAVFKKMPTGYQQVAALKAGEWHQVRLSLDTLNRRCDIVIAAAAGQTAFQTECLPGWDGKIDYSFIDSYGHIPGARPAIDADNFVVQADAVPDFGLIVTAQDSLARQQQIQKLRQQLAELQSQSELLDQELRTLLANGPYPMAYAMSEGTPHDVPIQLRGEPAQPGKTVPRGFLKIAGGQQPTTALTGSGRLQLADWLVSSHNPLTARVIVNRIWQHHFGTGLVQTANDFGVRGTPPTDPQLLDYLAARFVRDGWSIKSLHRLILNSAAWQQSSAVAEAAASHSVSRRRLSAEEIRDSILAVSGRLDRSVGTSHPFPRSVDWGFSQHVPFSEVYDHRLRSVYLMTPRIRRHPFLALFDGPDTNASTADRSRTTVPTQALFFMNDPLVHEAAAAWALQLEQTASEDPPRIRTAWLTALLREPDPDELSDALDFMQAYNRQPAADNRGRKSLEAVLRSILGSNEFLYVD